MSKINQVGKHGGHQWGVKFIVCGNDEVLAKRLDLDPEDPDLEAVTNEAFKNLVRVLWWEHGMDFRQELSFRAYNGGPYTGMVDAVWYRSPEFEDDGPPEWSRVWFAGPGAVDIPSEIVGWVEEIIDAAENAALDEPGVFSRNS